MALLQRHFHRPGRAIGIGACGVYHQLVVQEQFAVRRSHADLIRAAFLRRQRSAEAGGLGAFRLHAQLWRGLAEGEIQLGVNFGRQRRAGQIGGGKVFRPHTGLPIRRLEGRGLHGLRQAQEVRAGCIGDRAAGKCRLDAIQHRYRMAGLAVVIAQQHRHLIGQRADHHDLLHRFLQRQQAVILQEDDAFARRLQGQRPVRGRIHGAVGNGRIGRSLRRIEHAHADTGGEQPVQRLVHHRLRHKPLRHRVGIGPGAGFGAFAEIGAVGVHAVAEGNRRCFRQALGEFVPFMNIADGAAVGGDITLELPGAAQQVVQQEVIGAGRLTVHAVVGAHQRTRLAIQDRGAEGRGIGVHLVVPADRHIHGMACRLRARMHGEVLGRGDGARMRRIIALQAGDEGDTHLRGQERVFAIGFLPPAPARIAEDVDVGRPEIQTAIHPFAPLAIVAHPRLGGDRGRHLMHQRRIETGGQAHGLRKDGGGARNGDAVQRLAPPVVGRHAQPRNRGGAVDQLLALFLQRHLGHQRCSALVHGEARIEPGRISRRMERHRRQGAGLGKGSGRKQCNCEQGGAVEHCSSGIRRDGASVTAHPLPHLAAD